MQIKNIRLRNFRGMEDVTVEFAPRVNIIVGDNGAGKSSLLKGLRILLSNILSEDEHILYAQIQKEDVRLTSGLIGDATTALQYHFPSIIEGDIELHSMVSHCKSARNNENSDSVMDNISHIYDKDYDPKLQQHMTQLLNDRNSELPLINYQGDQKNLLSVSSMKQMLPGIIERRQGYACALTGVFDEDIIQNWCLRMELISYQEKRNIAEYENFRRAVAQFIGLIDKKESQGEIYFAADMMTLVYSNGKNRLPLYSLSSGYQSILCMIIELAYRVAIWNPRMSDYQSVEGVVIIDEIDVHLHPKWQWKIIDVLHSMFPKVQFIIATHSPIIISSAEGAKLFLMMSPNEIEELPDAYGINVDNILELRQQSDDMPPELKKWQKEIISSLNHNDIRGAETLIQKAEIQHGKDSALVQKLREFFEINKWIADT